MQGHSAAAAWREPYVGCQHAAERGDDIDVLGLYRAGERLDCGKRLGQWGQLADTLLRLGIGDHGRFLAKPRRAVKAT